MEKICVNINRRLKMRGIFFFLWFIPSLTYAQLEKVLVETYYISDTNDATDTIGGYLAPGSKTYRIYIDMAKGSKLKKIYGDVNHALIFQSTDTFFNNVADGQTFAKEIAKNRYSENTVALDTWLTLGQTTRIASKTYFGVMKKYDSSGSFIGGVNNDGGSATIANGLLSNNDPDAGLPLTISDGMDTLIGFPTIWADYGIIDLNTGIDSSIFGSVVAGNKFYSNDAGLLNAGASGVNADSNQVLIAQLTTKGDIAFELNVVIMDSSGNDISYVANDSVLLPGEVLNRYLKYPYTPVCGCNDADYLEFLANRDCDNADSCKHRIVFGCMDPLACNYDANVNFNIASLCCYPGYCNDRDIALICPQFNNERKNKFNFSVYPNPASDKICVQLEAKPINPINYSIYSIYGVKMINTSTERVQSFCVSTSTWASGLYVIKLNDGNEIKSGLFIIK
jgi:hypothetical protein